jgi:hypothetical protein
MRAAVDWAAANQDDLSSTLLTRALFRAVTDAFDGAREDLDEAYEIAERGPMRLHLADIHLHRARLFCLMPNRPADYPGPRHATTSTRRQDSSNNAAMAAAVKSWPTPRRPTSASMAAPGSAFHSGLVEAQVYGRMTCAAIAPIFRS